MMFRTGVALVALAGVGVATAIGYGVHDLRWFTVNAMKSAFLPFDERLAIIDDVIKPAYAVLATVS